MNFCICLNVEANIFSTGGCMLGLPIKLGLQQSNIVCCVYHRCLFKHCPPGGHLRPGGNESGHSESGQETIQTGNYTDILIGLMDSFLGITNID
jgi:hypothetical protein